MSQIENNKIKTDKPNDLFVVDYKLEKNKFIFVLSSLNLLKNALDENQLHKGFACIDVTYKLTTCKFPLAIISTRDKERKLKQIGFTILSEETRDSFIFVVESLKLVIEKELNVPWNVKVSSLLEFSYLKDYYE